MSKAIARLQGFVDNPFVLLTVGLILFVTSISEVAETFWDDLHSHHIRASHGVLVFGLYSMLQALPHVFEALDKFVAAHRKREDG